LHTTPLEDIVFLTTISHHSEVEIPKESWEALGLSFSVFSLTIVLRHGMFLVAYDDVAVTDRGTSLERLALEDQT
jgi:hypothetical protein